jgi:small subunit ribosomal protein S25e
MSSQKKKWGKGKQAKEKREWSTVLLAEVAVEIEKNTPRAKLITPAKLAERYKISLTVARKVLRQLEADGKIQRLASHHTLDVYGRAPGTEDPVVEAEAAQTEEPAKKGGKKGQPQKGKKGKKDDEGDEAEPETAK